MIRALALFAFTAGLMPLSAQQSAVPASTAAPRFEVASVKRNVSGDSMTRFQIPPNGTVNITNATVRQIIEQAYSLRRPNFSLVVPANNPLIPDGDVREQMAAPHFDIQAKIPEGAEPGSSRAMLRTLLAERFELRVHQETRDVPAYALTVAREGRLGPALRSSAVDCSRYEMERRKNPDIELPVGADGRPVCTNWASSIVAGKLTLRSAGQFGVLISGLQPYLTRPIVDNTRLTGLFEWTVTFAIIPEDPAFDTREAGLLTAVRDQLGLRLEPSTTPYDVLVVDSVETPTEN